MSDYEKLKDVIRASRVASADAGAALAKIRKILGSDATPEPEPEKSERKASESHDRKEPDTAGFDRKK